MSLQLDEAFFLSSQFPRKNAIIQVWHLLEDSQDAVTVVSSSMFWCDQGALVGLLDYIKGKFTESNALAVNTTALIITAYASLKLDNGSTIWMLQYVTPGAEKLFPANGATPPVQPLVA